MKNLKQRLRRGLFLSGFIIVAGSALTQFASMQWSRSAQRISACEEVISLLDRAPFALTETETAERGYILTLDPQYLTEFRDSASSAARLFRELDRAASDFPEIETDVRSLRDLAWAELAGMDARVRIPPGQDLTPPGKGRLMREAVRALAGRARQRETTLLRAQEEQMKRSRLMTAGLSAAGSLIAFAILGFSTRQVRRVEAAEKAADSLQRRFNAFMENIPAAVFIKDSEGRLVFCNSMMERLWRMEPGAWMGCASGAHLPSGIAEQMRADDRQVFAEDRAMEFINRLQFPDGEMRTNLTVKFPFRSTEDRRFLGGIAIDITERRNTEDALRLSEARLREAQEIARLGHWAVDIPSGSIEWSEETYRMFGLDPSVGPPEAQDFIGRLHPDDRDEVLAVSQRTTSENAPFDLEYRVILPDGEVRYIHSRARRTVDADGVPVRVTGTVIDVTEQKQAEERTLSALAEKELLLKEVHHRVKNNLQVICSLLGMQAAALEDRSAILALRESHDRVQSMAMVHEMFYGSESLGDIDFREYAQRLLSELSASFGVASSRVRLNAAVSPLRLDIDRAIPCGLILNELICNSFKYAFPDGREGGISVSLCHCEDRRVRLAVEDDGIGLPDGFSIGNTHSLGLSIVKILSQQLNGTLHVESREGTRFEVVFPLSGAA
jgi:PAS domain S-box-containing protein